MTPRRCRCGWRQAGGKQRRSKELGRLGAPGLHGTRGREHTPAPCMLPPPLRSAPQAAVEAANKSPGLIQLPAGTYRLSKPLVITSSGVVLRGEGVSGRAGGLLLCIRKGAMRVCGGVGARAAEATAAHQRISSACVMLCLS